MPMRMLPMRWTLLFQINGANLELTDSDGTLSVALANLGSDDQDISTTGAAGNITIEDGSTLNLNVDDADADASNEYNTGGGLRRSRS